MAQALTEAHRLDRARRRFEQAIMYANDVRLLAEEVDAGSGEVAQKLRIGLDGTEREINRAEYGAAPPGDDLRMPLRVRAWR